METASQKFFFQLKRWDTVSATDVMCQNKRWLTTPGIPDEATSDNGVPGNDGAVWNEFAATYGFKQYHIPNSHRPKASLRNLLELPKRYC